MSGSGREPPAMSDAPIDYSDPINLRAALARIDRDRAERDRDTAKMRAILARRMKRDPWIFALTIAGIIVAGVVARLPEILHAFGIGH